MPNVRFGTNIVPVNGIAVRPPWRCEEFERFRSSLTTMRIQAKKVKKSPTFPGQEVKVLYQGVDRCHKLLFINLLYYCFFSSELNRFNYSEIV